MALKRITDLPAASTLIGDELLEVSQLSTSVTITAMTISAQASDNSYNDSGSGFVSAGFAVNDRVKVIGFTGDVANNILVGVITALTAAKMTIGGTDGDVIVDDTAGESVTISKWTSKRATLNDIGIGSGSGNSYYDLRFGFSSTPASDEVLDIFVTGREITLPANLSGSVGSVVTNPTSSFVLLLKDDGTTIATITVSTSGTFTFATTGGTSQIVAVGSLLSLVAPTTVDATVADLTMTILGVAS